ncbi:MAG TPA: hypothetical protein ENF38_01445 [Candidatus Aenigmarchaeota archaeon]|nr:hypothetical protein [Candidatus Aenigmarchaeota archaeon]
MGLFAKRKFDERNLIVNCNWEDEDETILNCDVAVKDENQQIIPVGAFKYERLRVPGRELKFRPLEAPKNLTVSERKQIEYVILKNFIPRK